jgi:Ala-tRNA(Pro) deacylase
VLAVVPATSWVDIEAIERIVERPLELVPEEDFPMLFRDCRPGAVPPIGEAYGIMTVVDDALTEPTDIYLEAGDHEHLIHVSHDSFLDLIEDFERGRISQSPSQT